MPYGQLTRATRQLCLRTCYDDLEHISQFRHYSQQRNLGFILERGKQSHNLTSPHSISLYTESGNTAEKIVADDKDNTWSYFNLILSYFAQSVNEFIV